MAKAKAHSKTTARNGAAAKKAGGVAAKAKKPQARPPKGGKTARAQAGAAPSVAKRGRSNSAANDGDAVLEHIGSVDARQQAVSGAQGNRGKYVYCIIRSTESLRFGPIGLGVEPSDVHVINYRDLA